MSVSEALVRSAQRAQSLHSGAGTLALSALPPLAVYVHLPWCLRKCPYCDFNSHEVRGDQGAAHALPEQRYVQALRADLEVSLPLVWGRRVSSVFIGGGTPSLFSPEAIGQILSDLRALLPIESNAEITLEANPGTFETQRFHAFAQAGVTRLSVGVQSFDDAALERLGRVHDGQQARRALQEAADAFESFNIDLMYALPGQDLPALRADLRTALSFSPPHLSVYHLTVEPNTFFAKHPPVLPDDDLAYAMLDEIAQATQGAGLKRYEVSAFAKAGRACAHNLNYWRFGDYLGLGAGAHGKLSFAHRIVRQVRYRDPAAYMQQALQGQAVSQESEVARAELPFEFMLNALRLREGFSLNLFSQRTGLPPSALEPGLTQALERGWLHWVDGQGVALPAHAPLGADAVVAPTTRGFDFLSDVQALFLPDSHMQKGAPVTVLRRAES